MIPKVMIVALSERHQTAEKVQKVLTKYGCIIKVRLGLHETDKVCSPCGLVVLHLADEPKEIKKLHADLNKIKNVQAKTVRMKC